MSTEDDQPAEWDTPSDGSVDEGDGDLWAEFRGDARVAATRADVFERCAQALRDARSTTVQVTRTLPAEPYYQTISTSHVLGSLLVLVGQYWSDNAYDEVHLFLAASSEADPEWPHDCPAYERGAEILPERFDGCCRCIRNLKNPYDWGYGALIPAFEAFCHEGADQDMETVDSHRPFALVTLDGDAPKVEIIGALVRPWLDRWTTPPPAVAPLSPRILALAGVPDSIDVLADALEEELPDDPRTALVRGLSTVESGAGRAWLGSFDRFVPRSGVRYERGIPVEIGLYIEAAEVAHLDRDAIMPWAFAPRVRFLPNSATPIWPALAACRAIGPIDEAGLYAIAEGDVPFRCEDLEVELELCDSLGLLNMPNLAAVRTLRVRPRVEAAHDVAAVVAGLSIERLELATPTDLLAETAERWRAANLPFPVSLVMYDADARRACGLVVTIDRGETTVTQRGYHRELTRELRRSAGLG